MARPARTKQQLLTDVPVMPVFRRAAKRLVKPRVTGCRANAPGYVAPRDLRLDSRC